MTRRQPSASERRARPRPPRTRAAEEERVLWARLAGRRLDGLDVRRRHRLGPYVLDFYCPDLNLAVLLEGGGPDHPQAEHDRSRADYLKTQGVEVLSMAKADVRRAPDETIEVLHRRIGELAARRGARPISAAAFHRGEAPVSRETEAISTDYGGAGRALLPRAFGEIEFDPEVAQRLAAFDSVLLDWSARHNLIARSTIEDRWARHYRDSAQLFDLIPDDARTLVDLGSGAGFPGLVLAAMGAVRGLQVTLVESTQKKAAFLSAAAAAMGLRTVTVAPERIETLRLAPPDVITARALAPLPKLLAYAHQIAGKNTLCLFLKGQDVGAELTEAAKYWNMTVDQRDSLTSVGSKVLAIRKLAPQPPRSSRA
jgi:16S rRNA (guanine527-N7)-methyltransferase